MSKRTLIWERLVAQREACKATGRNPGAYDMDEVKAALDATPAVAATGHYYARATGMLGYELLAAVDEITRLRWELRRLARVESVCCYCKRVTVAREPVDTSHGICSECMEREHPEDMVEAVEGVVAR